MKIKRKGIMINRTVYESPVNIYKKPLHNLETNKNFYPMTKHPLEVYQTYVNTLYT